MQQGVARDEVERIRLAQAQQDGQRQVEAPLRLVQLRQRLQQRRAVAAGAARPARQPEQAPQWIDAAKSSSYGLLQTYPAHCHPFNAAQTVRRFLQCSLLYSLVLLYSMVVCHPMYALMQSQI